MTLYDVWQIPDPGQVSEAFGGGLAGLLAVIIVSLSGVLWLTINGRLKDCKEANIDLKATNTTLTGKIDGLTTAVERLSLVVERQGTQIEGLHRELERRRGRS